MEGETPKTLEIIFGGTVAFCALNALLLGVDVAARWDFLFANSAVGIAAYFAYLTKEIHRIKETLKNILPQQKHIMGLAHNKRGQLEWIALLVLLLLLGVYLYLRYPGA